MRQVVDRRYPGELQLSVGAADYSEVFHEAGDGAKLFARDYHRGGSLTPVVCLPGLTRNSKDFGTLAPLLAARRRVICPDFRGRGKSSYTDPAAYRPNVEASDTLALLDRLGIGRVAIIGTSRGGIVAMVTAALAPGRLAGAAFNDIGPKIEMAGLLRIRSYLGADPQFASWEQAVLALKATNPGFATLRDAEWMAFARRVFRDENGLPRADYDAGLAQNFPSAGDIEAGNVPELWELFDAMVQLPMLVLRGEYSDLLSAGTVAGMRRRSPSLASMTVKDRGHVPFLDEPESLAAIDDWLLAVDGRD